MGGDGDQWLIIRNTRGAELLALIAPNLITKPLTDKGKRGSAVKGFLENTARAAGGMPLRRMPNWLRPVVSFLQPRIGPRGLEFARARVEMKAVETILHLRRTCPGTMFFSRAGWVRRRWNAMGWCRKRTRSANPRPHPAPP